MPKLSGLSRRMGSPENHDCDRYEGYVDGDDHLHHLQYRVEHVDGVELGDEDDGDEDVDDDLQNRVEHVDEDEQGGDEKPASTCNVVTWQEETRPGDRNKEP